MFFTKAASVVAHLVFVVGILRFSVAFIAAYTDNQQLATRYLGGGAAGNYIDEALRMVVLGIVVGVLCEISRSISKIAEVEDEKT